MTIVCSGLRGALTGEVVFPPDAPDALATRAVPCSLDYGSATVSYLPERASDGAFLLEGIGVGICNVRFGTLDRDAGLRYEALVEKVEILPDETTDIGVVHLEVSELKR